MLFNHNAVQALTCTTLCRNLPDLPMEPEKLTEPAISGPCIQLATDLATVVAIALVVYASSAVLHEAVGHGLTSVLLGGKVALIASTVCVPAGDPLGQNAARLVAAAGSVMNLSAAAVFRGLLSRFRAASPWLRYFFWLTMTVNGFIGAGYMAVPTLIGFGGWMNVLQGLQGYWFWRGSVICLGVILYGVIWYVAMRELQPFLSQEVSQSRSRAIKLTLIPYLAGGLAFCLAGLFNPVGMKLVLISAAAAAFGGTSGLVWLSVIAIRLKPGATVPPRALARNWRWIIMGLVSALLLIGVLGPGVRFHH